MGHAAPQRPVAEDCAARLICPICEAPLRVANGSLRCDARHTFDISRHGDVDLLPPGHGRSKLRGDTAEMVSARRWFLDRGHYTPLVRAVTRIAVERLAATEPGAGPTRAILEVGTGTGYFVGAVHRALTSELGENGVCSYGLDISPAAVRLAARAYPQVRFFVNDVWHRICLATASIDLLLDVFAPRNPAEFARVVRPGGAVIVVVPGAGHLAELAEHVTLVSVEADKRERTLAALSGAYDLAAEETLEYAMDLTGGDVDAVLRMTPNAWHVAEEERRRVAEYERLRVTASFTILTLIRSTSSPTPA